MRHCTTSGLKTIRGLQSAALICFVSTALTVITSQTKADGNVEAILRSARDSAPALAIAHRDQLQSVFTPDFDEHHPDAKTARESMLEHGGEIAHLSARTDLARAQCDKVETPPSPPARKTISFSKNHSPCPGKKCRETCTYKGKASGSWNLINGDGELEIKTIYDNLDGKPKVRILLVSRIETLMVDLDVRLDERDTFDAKATRLTQVDQALLTTIDHAFNKYVQRPSWQRAEISENTISRRQIAATRIDEGPSEWRPFMKKNSAPGEFGGKWYEEFDSFAPAPKGQSEQPPPKELLSAVAVPFFHLRFAPSDAENVEYSVLTSDKDFSRAVRSIGFSTEKPSANTTMYYGDLLFDKYSNVPGKPATFEIDTSTHELKRIQFDVTDKTGNLSLQATASLAGCKVDPQ
jgi:hypothetical protein